MSKFSRLSIYAASAVCLSLSACAFSKDPGPSEEAKKLSRLESEKSLVEADLKHEYTSDPEKLNSYKLTVSWPVGRPVTVRIVEKDAIKSYDARTMGQHETKCEGSRYAYKFQTINADGATVGSIDLSGECPIDVAVDPSIAAVTVVETISRVTGRLKIKGGTIIPVTSPLDLKFRSLEIDGTAIVKTFESDTAYKPGVIHATTAPAIKLQAEKATGTLRFELNGIDGAPVAAMPDFYQPNLNGDAGSDGTFKLETVRGKNTVGSESEMLFASCENEPGQGRRGKDAATHQADGRNVKFQGRKGHPANRGVGTSDLRISIAQPEGFKMHVVFNPGKGSAPGVGELPKGGLGGPAGNAPVAPAGYVVTKPCSVASSGAAGADGERGDFGDTAPESKCGTIELTSNLKSLLTNEDKHQQCSRWPGIIKEI